MEKSTTDMTSKEYWESRYMSFITTSPNIRKLLHEPFAPLDKRYINNNLIKMEKKRKLRINAGNGGKVKISIHRLISRLQDGDDIQVLCCLSSFRKLQKYNNQSYISEDGKQKFLNLNGLLHLQKYIKNIYIL